MSARRIAAMTGFATVLALVATAAPAAAADTTAGTSRHRVVVATATLDGAQEVPARDVAGVGVAVVTVKVRTAKVCYILVASRLTGPAVAAHIHRAAAGANGPVVVPLATPANVSRACVTVTAELAAQLAATPSQFYVNVHTAAFPGGEIRGQLG